MTNLILYTVSVLIWGSTWLAIEFQLGVVPVEVSLAYRYLLAAALAFAWCRFSGAGLRFEWRAHRYFILMGTFMFGLNYLAAYAAQIYITSALNAIGFSAMVWLNIINARVFLGARIDRSTSLGAALGIVGILIIFWPQVEDISLSDRIFIGACLSLTGALLASGRRARPGRRGATRPRRRLRPRFAFGGLPGIRGSRMCRTPGGTARPRRAHPRRRSWCGSPGSTSQQSGRRAASSSTDSHVGGLHPEVGLAQVAARSGSTYPASGSSATRTVPISRPRGLSADAPAEPVGQQLVAVADAEERRSRPRRPPHSQPAARSLQGSRSLTIAAEPVATTAPATCLRIRQRRSPSMDRHHLRRLLPGRVPRPATIQSS